MSCLMKAQFDTNPQSFTSTPEPFPSSLPFKVSANKKGESEGIEAWTPIPLLPSSTLSDDDERHRVDSPPDLVLPASNVIIEGIGKD